jgi:3-(3-hydroxy-phenyl)propionate hydroxylase
VDFRLGVDLPNERTVWLEAADNDGRAVWFHRMGDDVWRLDFQIGPREAAEAMTREALAADIVRRMLRRIVGGDVPFELVWVGPWTYRSFVLDRLRHGRFFFAGDAAHLMSPFGARGGNSGIQDADNLGWKLARVLAGTSPEALLDSYDGERRQAAIENVRTTDRTAAFLHPPHRAARQFRSAVLDLSRDMPFARALANGGRMAVANVYRDSPLAGPDAAAGELPPALAPGCPAVNLRIAADPAAPFLFDRLGVDFAAFWFGEGPAPAAPIPVVAVTAPQTRAAYGGGLYLIRPDGYVAWRAAKADAAALAAGLARATARS